MNYWKIDKEDVCNGEGLRVVLWLSGCSHECIGCQNPQTWDADSGILFDKAAKEELFKELDKNYISGLTLTGGDPLNESNLNNVLNLVFEVNKRYNKTQYIDKKKRYMYNMLSGDANEFRLSRPQKSIWLYTGYTWENIWNCGIHGTDLYGKSWDAYSIYKLRRQEIVKQCDVLVDGEYIEEQRDITLKWCGSRNQRVIDVQKTLQQGNIILWSD